MKKIVAVIPARAGSKGVPNKNVRFIAGKPLIAYAIDNALNSKFITDIIISTDSEDVKIIAGLKNAKVHERSQDLCGDMVTLDAVIYDAVKNYDCDYVVTMQPTSPTLKPETLDAAIEQAISTDVDTLISVQNKPHLAWIKNELGELVPAYKERLNRQYMPPYYIETGAFVIAKKDVVTEKTRIGKKVSVFEISPDEAVDIDSFDDLIVSKNILRREKIAFYVRGNDLIGRNSIIRSLELADSFNSKVDIFFDSAKTPESLFGKTTHNLIKTVNLQDLSKKLYEGEYTIFINDIAETTADYMQIVKKSLPKAKIINFEDYGPGSIYADIVFNSLPTNQNSANVMNDAKYFIPNKKFLYYPPVKIKERVKNIFISFGGIDAQNYTDRLLQIVSQAKYKDKNFYIVLGCGKFNKEKLQKAYENYSNIFIFKDVSNMPSIMTACDIGITSSGRTCYELALLGIPCITLSQNDMEENNVFICQKNGFQRLGINPSDATIENMLDLYIKMSQADREFQQTLLLKHDLKNGCEHVVKQVNAIL